MKKIFNLVMVLMGLSPLFTTISCIDNDPDQENFRTFTGQTVASYLTSEANEGEFSEFVQVLERADLLGLLKTYGDFTCFAPTNEAMQKYLAEHNFANVDAMEKAECDTLAWMHIINGKALYITDCDESKTEQNMNKRYLKLSCDTVADKGGNIAWRVNGSRLIAQDDSVVNGVVHVVNQIITASNVMVGDLVISDPHISIFADAFNLTHLNDSMAIFRDESYDPDQAMLNSKDNIRVFGNNNCHWSIPSERLFKYTIFAEPDSVFIAKGIHNVEELFAYAKSIYDETYPKDAGKYDNDYTNRRNPLNRFIAYHILDRELPYDELTVSNTDIKDYFVKDSLDIQEFYETLCPYTIMKISDAGTDKYLNRCGLGTRKDKLKVKGCRIWRDNEANAMNKDYSNAPNGTYFYIDDILTYDKPKTIDIVLNTRIRLDATTLSPDFSNAGARNSDAAKMSQTTGNIFYMMRFLNGYTKNFVFGDQTFYAVHSRVGYFNSWEGDNCACLDQFDIKFRIPPVPAEMTYEVRLGYTCGENRTVVQVYFDDNLTGDMPCGIPVDLRKYAGEYGWRSDEEFKLEDGTYDQEGIEANDKALRNNGYMKAYDGYLLGGGNTARSQGHILRRILTTKYLEAEHNYYIRLRQVLQNVGAEMSLDYIEIVPKTVYAGAVPEDRH